jgi:hypothetical protein
VFGKTVEVLMRLTNLEPVREDKNLVGWTARFLDEKGQVRLAQLNLSSLMDPTSFAQSVSKQGVRYEPPCGDDRQAWQQLVSEVRRQPSATPSATARPR